MEPVVSDTLKTFGDQVPVLIHPLEPDFLGRVQRGRDGLTESRLCRRRCRAGPHPQGDP